MLKRGQIYYIENEGTHARNEQSGTRPAVIISNDVGNFYSPVVIVAYLTTRTKNHLPTHVFTMATGRGSTVLCEQIVTVSKDRIGSYAGTVSENEMVAINRAISVSLGIS